MKLIWTIWNSNMFFIVALFTLFHEKQMNVSKRFRKASHSLYCSVLLTDLFLCFLCAIFGHISTAIWCWNWGNPLFFKSCYPLYRKKGFIFPWTDGENFDLAETNLQLLVQQVLRVILQEVENLPSFGFLE